MIRSWEIKFEISKTNKKPVYLQIVDTIIESIKNKRLLPNEPLPGSRKLAQEIGVNRNTLVKALDILIAEGWLVSKERSGVFIADIAIQENVEKTLPNTAEPFQKQYEIILDDGVPDTKIAPVKQLASAYRRAFGLISKYNSLGYADSSGSLKFRKMVSQMLNHDRGMSTSFDDVFITRGSQMALYLIAQCILKKSDFIIVENPGYTAAWNAFKSTGANLIPVQVDNEGINVQEVERQLRLNNKIKAIYLTPHHQYPTTVTLSLKRRLKLIQLSNHYNFTIIEDDYDHEFHFDTRPVFPISSYSGINNYAYIGTFSKIVAPSLRIGYINAPKDLIQKVKELRQIIDVQNDLIMESALVELIKSGDIKRHVKRATTIYLKKREKLANLLNHHLKSHITFHVPLGGLAFWIKPKGDIDMIKLKDYLASFDIRLVDFSKYHLDHSLSGIRLGYANISDEDLEKSIARMAVFFKMENEK